MKRKNVGRALLCGLLLLTVVTGLCLPVRAATKYIECSNAEVFLWLDEAGEARVEETWDCFFGGETITRYTRRYRPLDSDLSKIDEIAVYLDGEELTCLSAPDDSRPEGCAAVYERDGQTNIDIYLNAHNEYHTITVSYCMSQAVTMYDDVAEFHWDLNSVRESFDIDVLDAQIVLPAAVEENDLSFWGHGPTENASFTALMEDGTADSFWLHTENIPKGRNVSVRFAMPLELFPDAVRQSDGSVYEQILQQEYGRQETITGDFPLLTEPTQETQPETQPQTQPEPDVEEEDERTFWDRICHFFTTLLDNLGYYFESLTSILFYIIAVLAAVPAVLLVCLPPLRKQAAKCTVISRQKKYRRKPGAAPQYYRMPPDDLKPAMVYKLLNVYSSAGGPSVKKGNPFTATLLDLIDRDLIHLERGEDGMLRYFVAPEAEEAELTVYESRLIQLYSRIGADQTPMTTQEITDYMRCNRCDSGRVHQEFLRYDLVDAFEKSGLSQQIAGIRFGKKAKILAWALLGLLLYGAVLDSVGSVLALICGVGGGLIGAQLLQTALRQLFPDFEILTGEGENRYAMWMAYRRFLTDFASFADRQSEDVKLWQRHLVYAAAMGCWPQVTQNLKSVLPQVYEALSWTYGLEHSDDREDIFDSLERMDRESSHSPGTTTTSGPSGGTSGDGRDWGGMSGGGGGDSGCGSSGGDFD